MSKLKTLLKGKEYTLKSLENQTNLAVKLVNKTSPKTTYIYAYTFVDDAIILRRVTDYGDYINIIFFSPSRKTEVSANVSKDFKVQKLTKASSKAMVKDYIEYKFKNLDLDHYMTVGSDPEIFVEDKEGQIIPAFNFLGSKEKPNKTAVNHGRGGASLGEKPLYWDGFQAEFVTAPNNCLAWQVDSVQCGLKGALIEARKHNPDAKLSLKTVMDIPLEMLRDAKDEHVNFGCMPSFNVYNMKGLQIP
jgi:hypothetical protein